MKADDKAYQTTASGLVYKVDNAGTGESPKDTDVVKVKYTGRHIELRPLLTPAATVPWISPSTA